MSAASLECEHGSLRRKCLVCELTAERDEARADRDALAKIVGDLWDYPPEGDDGTTDAHRDHLSERWGDEVATVWDRLSDPPSEHTQTYDGWVIS